MELSSTSSYLPFVNNVLFVISGIRSMIDQVLRDPIMWNSEGPFLLNKDRFQLNFKFPLRTEKDAYMVW